MKIVINKCYGGFGLSLKAMLRYSELKGFKLFAYTQTKYKHRDKIDEYSKIEIENNSFMKYYQKEDLGKITNKLKDDSYFSEYDIERTDEDLIKVVEELGEQANGDCSSLKIVEIPNNVKWELDEYDGIESVHEVHRSW